MSRRSRRKSMFYKGALYVAVVLALLVGGGTRYEASAQTEKPGFFESKAIAETGFIYGLPLVMNYAIMYDYVIDRNSGPQSSAIQRNPAQSSAIQRNPAQSRTAQSRTPNQRNPDAIQDTQYSESRTPKNFYGNRNQSSDRIMCDAGRWRSQ